MMVFAPDARIQPHPRAAHRALGGNGGGVVLHLDTGAYFQLNTVGSEIWGAVAEGTTYRRLVTQLREVFPDAPAGLEDDVSAYLNALSASDLILVDQPAD